MTIKGVTFLVLTAIVVATGLFLARWFWVDPEEELQRGRPAPTVRVAEVEFSSFSETIRAHGTMRANEAVELTSEISGIVEEVLFRDGAPVEQGEVLLQIDARVLEAELQTAKRRLSFATQEQARQSRLLADGGTTEVEFDASVFEKELAEAQVELIQTQLERTTIKAPFDGLLGLRRVSPGDHISPGAPIVSLRQIDPLKVDFPIPERYLGRVSEGMEITIKLPGVGNSREGRVVAREPQIDEATRTLTLRAVVENPDGALLPGGFASIDLVLDEIPDAILIPAAALVPGLGRNLVYVVDDEDQAHEREVVIGTRTRDKVLIRDGLEAGEKIVIEGVQGVRPGASVQIVE